jgi:hypothetical protein
MQASVAGAKARRPLSAVSAVDMIVTESFLYARDSGAGCYVTRPHYLRLLTTACICSSAFYQVGELQKDLTVSATLHCDREFS